MGNINRQYRLIALEVVVEKENKTKRPNEVGADLDEPSQYKLLRVVLNAKNIAWKIKIMETKNGYHIYLYFTRPLTIEENITIRLYLGDCKGRLLYDEFRPVKWRDTLYQSVRKKPKEKKPRFEVEVDLKNILCLPFFSRVRREIYKCLWRKRRKSG